MASFPADQFGVSSLHMTFNTADEANALAQLGYLQRSGIQYHWENRGYTTFEDFLADLRQSKRKNIRQVSLLRPTTPYTPGVNSTLGHNRSAITVL